MVTFIVTLWREEMTDAGEGAWRGALKPVLPRAEDDDEPITIPFVGLAALPHAIHRGLESLLGPRP